ncbi:hypothetical protein OBRU01_25786, partial [Operophtera brumata]
RTSHLVCSVHFEDSSIKIIKHLKDNALPSKLLHNQPQESSSSETQSTSAGVKGKVTICSNKIIKDGSCSSEVQSTSAQMKGEGCKEIILSINKQYVTVATQTESLQSKEQQTQTLKSLTEKTPRKRKLSNEVPGCNLKRVKLDQELTKSKELEANNLSPTRNDPDDETYSRFQKLIEWQNTIKNKYKGNRYDAEFKVFALNLHYSSPHAYKCLQSLLKLPCKSTLNRFKIHIPPKFDNRVLDSLALKLKSLPDAAKYCTICVDEMSLKKNLYYNVKNDEVIGFHNVNGQISPVIASNAFVLLLQGIYVKWNQPLAYALVASAKHYEEIELWIKEVITKLSTIGIKVKAIVSDQAANFVKFAKEIAVQTLSRTVSAALHTYIDLGNISEDARPTADFLQLMNDLFDVLNSSKINGCNKFQVPFTLNKNQENLLNNSKEMFAASEAINRNTGKNNTACPDLNNVLETVPELSKTNLFTRYKDLNKESGFYGSLKMPPKEFIQYVQNLET